MEAEHPIYVSQANAIAAALSVLALGSPLITACANSLANNSYDSGIEKYAQGNYQGAIADFNQAIEINPQYANACYNRGLAKYDLKNIIKERFLITLRQ